MNLMSCMVLLCLFLNSWALDLDSTVWNTNWELMYFWQNGDTVQGEYIYDGGILTGRLTGDTLRGWWRENNNSKGCGPGAEWCGPLLFLFSSEGTTFTGSWGYCSADPSTLDPAGSGWTGTIKNGFTSFTQQECENAGRFWCHDSCSLSPCDQAINENACLATGRFWCSGLCQMTPCETTPVRKPETKRYFATETSAAAGIHRSYYDIRGRRTKEYVQGVRIFLDSQKKYRVDVTMTR